MTDAAANSRAGERVWPYLIAILLLPVVVLWRQDNPLFTPPGQIDSWVYLGFFRNLANFKRELFPGTYYGSRLSWILPGYFLHAVFSPVAASAILHLAVLWVSMHSLFTTLRLTVGARGAFLGSLVFGVNPQVWYVSGWDYVYGAGIAYCLLTMALLTRAALRDTPAPYLLPAGMAIAGLVYVNLFYVVFVPLLLLYYAVLSWSRQRAGTVRLVLHGMVWSGAGFLIVTLLLCAINYSLDGTFWFYAPSLEVAPGLTHNNPWHRSPWTSRGLGPWLWFPAGAVLTALVLLPFRLRRAVWKSQVAASLFSIQLLLAAAAFVYLQLARRLAVLGLAYYSSALLPFVFLAIGSSFWPSVDRMRRGTYILLCCLSAAGFGAVWSDYLGAVSPMWPAAIWPTAVAGAAALSAALWQRQRAAGAMLAMAGLALLTAEVRFISKEQVTTEVPVAKPKGPHAYRHALERAIQVAAQIESVRKGRAVRFWYDEQESASADYTALNATYLYLYTRLGTPFPQLSCDAQIEPDSVVVVSSMREHVADIALAALSNCGNRKGLLASVVSNSTIDSPNGAYTTAILSMVRDPSRWHVLQTTFDSTGKAAVRLTGYSKSGGVLPVERWTALYPDLGAAIRRVPEGMELRTPRKPHTDAASYGPLVAPASGRYGFVLRCTPRSGKVVFGVVSGDASTWLAADVAGHAGSGNKMECWVDLQKGQTIMLRIANAADAGASLVINGVTAVEFDGEIAPASAQTRK